MDKDTQGKAIVKQATAAAAMLLVAGFLMLGFFVEDLRIDNVFYNITSRFLGREIRTVSDLNRLFNAHETSAADVRDAIRGNRRLDNYQTLLLGFVNEVERVRPNHNWWVFYQNIKRMAIEPVDWLAAQSIIGTQQGQGRFFVHSSRIAYYSNMPHETFLRIMVHELTHAMDIIIFEYEGRAVNTAFHNIETGAGTSVMEVLTTIFEVRIYRAMGGRDVFLSKYRNMIRLLQPLIDEVGEAEIVNYLFEGNIETFNRSMRRYYRDIAILTEYMDTFWGYSNALIDADFLNSFVRRNIDFYLTMAARRLQNGALAQNVYETEARSFRSWMHDLAAVAWRDNVAGQRFMDRAEFDEMFEEMERRIFDGR